uniref:WGS project CBMI000000000 data, contig CS3069_c002479 n=1 Tax=Fusarium clavum TaxID=2594811 RepID=A0A090N5Q6_9HYPO|nr:unnamed protein product [Fusarium clavum]
MSMHHSRFSNFAMGPSADHFGTSTSRLYLRVMEVAAGYSYHSREVSASDEIANPATIEGCNIANPSQL